MQTSTTHLSDTASPISSVPGHRWLHSATTKEFDGPRTKVKLGDRAFSVAWPREWNTLPDDIRNITYVPTFKRAIKIHFLDCHARITLNFFYCYFVRRIWSILRGWNMRHRNWFYFTNHLLKNFRLVLTNYVDGWSPTDLNWMPTRRNASGWQQRSDS